MRVDLVLDLLDVSHDEMSFRFLNRVWRRILMSRIARIVVSSMVIAIVLLTVPMAGAKPATEPAPGPIPVQILTGKKCLSPMGKAMQKRQFLT